MKLCMISENRLTDLFKQLDKNLAFVSEEALEGLVEDPKAVMTLIRKGTSSRNLVLEDEDWIRQFLMQWQLLDTDETMEIFEAVYEDAMEKINKKKKDDRNRSQSQQTQSEQLLRSEILLSEGVGSFLSKLAKWMVLFVQLLATMSSSRGGRKSGNVSDINSYVVYNLTKGLYQASKEKAEQRGAP